MPNLLLETGIIWEYTKHYAPAAVTALHEGIQDLCDRYDALYGRPEPCTGDITCQRTGTRHKAGCIGRTLPFEQYARAMR